MYRRYIYSSHYLEHECDCIPQIRFETLNTHSRLRSVGKLSVGYVEVKFKLHFVRKPSRGLIGIKNLKKVGENITSASVSYLSSHAIMLFCCVHTRMFVLLTKSYD